jgi:hypothetical protein
MAPVFRFPARLELHRLDIGAGHNEMALDVAHGEGGHSGWSSFGSPISTYPHPPHR